jgi:hypothetical protein
MRAPQDWRITVQFARGRKRYYGRDGKEIRAEKVASWLADGLLEPVDPGLFDDPQSYRFVRPYARQSAV